MSMEWQISRNLLKEREGKICVNYWFGISLLASSHEPGEQIVDKSQNQVGSFSMERYGPGLKKQLQNISGFDEKCVMGSWCVRKHALRWYCYYKNSWDEHLSHIRDVLERLRSANLTARASKTQFAREETKCLGFMVGNGKIAPVLDKVKAVENFPVRTLKKSDLAFLGVKGYYRRYI